MAAHLDDMRGVLNAAVRTAAAGWSGEASNAFSEHWDTMAPEMDTGAEAMREVATASGHGG